MIQLDQRADAYSRHELYSFLEKQSPAWLHAYCADEQAFYDLLDEEDVKTFVYKNESDALSGVVLLMENAILVASFSEEVRTEEDFSLVLSDMIAYVKKAHYTSLFYGEGDCSFGAYDVENALFGAFLKTRGFIVEAVAYDLLYTASQIVERHVDQLKAQKIKEDFSVCGRYESMALEL